MCVLHLRMFGRAFRVHGPVSLRYSLDMHACCAANDRPAHWLLCCRRHSAVAAAAAVVCRRSTEESLTWQRNQRANRRTTCCTNALNCCLLAVSRCSLSAKLLHGDWTMGAANVMTCRIRINGTMDNTHTHTHRVASKPFVLYSIRCLFHVSLLAVSRAFVYMLDIRSALCSDTFRLLTSTTPEIAERDRLRAFFSDEQKRRHSKTLFCTRTAFSRSLVIVGVWIEMWVLFDARQSLRQEPIKSVV